MNWGGLLYWCFTLHLWLPITIGSNQGERCTLHMLMCVSWPIDFLVWGMCASGVIGQSYNTVWLIYGASTVQLRHESPGPFHAKKTLRS